MAKTRSSKKPEEPLDDESLHSKEPSEAGSEVEEPPQPVSSDDEHDDSGHADAFQHVQRRGSAKSNITTTPTSRLFAPYRSLGIISSGRPFHVLSHERATLLCVPINDRFQILSERLQPVMVSQAVSSGTIQHLVADATLSATVVAHGSLRVSLFHRTKTVDSRSVQTKKIKGCSITGMLHLGRMQVDMKGEMEGKQENSAIVAVIVGRESSEEDDSPVVGDEASDDESDNDSDTSQSQGKPDDAAAGQVVIMLASRQNLEIQQRITLDFCALAAIHPPTYVNKIVVGGFCTRADGSKHLTMSLVNVRSTKVVHTFKCLPNVKDSWITTMQPSPAVDTIAVGTNDGHVHLVNLRHDKLLFSLHHKSSNRESSLSITSISFRTDSSAFQYGIAPMAVGRNDGTVTVWDLTPSTEDGSRQVLTEMAGLHSGGVGNLQYLPNEPVLVSIGTESNAILVHLFDSPNHTGRILRQRLGHSAPPSLIRYLHPATGGLAQHDGTDASACQILSTGGSDRSLRIFSTARTVLDKEYSQGPKLGKRAKKIGVDATELLLPPVLALATSELNQRDWGDLVTIHREHAFAYVWSTKRGAQAGPLLKQADWNISAMKNAPAPNCHATSVCMSACGHFALVGTRGGTVYKYNVQSGQTRGSYPRNLEEATNEKDRKMRKPGDINRTLKAIEKKMKISNRVSNLDKQDMDAKGDAGLDERRRIKLATSSHAGFAVTGLAVDSVNRVLISVGSDKKIILWHFTTHAPHSKSPFTLPAAATKMCHIRESDLAAIAMADFSVVLFDCSTLAVVRRFGAQGSSARHSGPISDLGFSPDGRTLYTSSLDSTIRVYDVPTNSCIDWLGFKKPPTSLTVSPTGEYLATTHLDQLGISVWSDRSFYQTVHVDGSALSEPAKMDEPMPIIDDEQAAKSSARPDLVVKLAVPSLLETAMSPGRDRLPIPKKSGLVTFSGLSPAHWKNLFHMELVKERNKPSEALKKPPTAPFFLQWRSGENAADSASPVDANATKSKDDDEGWAEAWSDDDDEKTHDVLSMNQNDMESKRRSSLPDDSIVPAKRAKVAHVRSRLASLLKEPSSQSADGRSYQHVTDHVASLGPSSIDVAISSLCNGAHDLEEGLPLLRSASLWLIEALETGERFEAVNAYLHRLLFLHAGVIAELERDELSDEKHKAQRLQLMDCISQLKRAQNTAAEALNNKMQHTLCLLRHFARMV